MKGLRKKMLLSIWAFTAGMLFGVEKSQAGEISADYLPLAMSFYYGFPARWGSLSADMTIYVFRLESVPGASEDAYEVDGPKLVHPSLEDWKAFYDACENADIWEIGKENRVISKDIAHKPIFPRLWQLNLKYPGRELDIEGEERFVDIDLACAMNLPGLDQEDEDFRWIISNNIDIVMKYDRIQSVWDAFGEYIIKGNKFPLFEKY